MAECTVCYTAIPTGEEFEDKESGLLFHKECFETFDIDDPEGELDPEHCPSCGSGPGDGYTEDCNDPDGCGFYKKELEKEAT